MLSSPGVVQPIEAQSYAGHPGSHHPGDHPLLLPGDHRPAIRPGSENRYTDHHCNSHLYKNLYLYANRFLDKDTYFDTHTDDHPNTNTDRQRFEHFYANLDPVPFSHLYAKRNTDSDTNLYFDAVFHIYQHPPAANSLSHTLI
jgi:hypothetical protein